MSRIHNKNLSIDYQKTKSFFQSRAKSHEMSSDPRIITTYQDKTPEVSQQRDELERNLLKQLVDFQSSLRVLEIGCGAGRWASIFSKYGATYLGIDYSDELISIAKQNFESEDSQIKFQVLSVDDIDSKKLCCAAPFNLIIVTGLVAYLNDNTTNHLFDQISKMGGIHSSIYVREPISVLDGRLTLKDHYSEEIGQDYNAIYRTEGELREYFDRFLLANGYSLTSSGFLYPKSLHYRKETKHKYFFFARKHCD